MSEALHTLIDYASNQLYLDFLVGLHFSWNKQPQSVIEKCAFKNFKDDFYITSFEKLETTRNCILLKD